MPQHPPHGFDGYTVGERYRGGEGMTGQMCGQVLFDATEVGNLLEVGIGLLIRQNGQESLPHHNVRMCRVLFQDGVVCPLRGKGKVRQQCELQFYVFG